MLSYVTNYQRMALHLRLRPAGNDMAMAPNGEFPEWLPVSPQFHPSVTRDKYPKNQSFRPKSSVSLFCDGNGGITAIFKHCHINEVKHPKYVCGFIDVDPMNTTYSSK